MNPTEQEARHGIGIAVIFLMSVAVVLFCIQLNQILYQKHAPFHDSLSYYLQIHRVMLSTQEVGMVEAIGQQLDNQTVFAPYLIASLLSYVMEPSRSVGMWIQGCELFVFLLSLYFFLTIVFRLRTATALVSCASFLTLDCVYFVNGGLSDFRMDLSLMLMFGTSVLWFLAALDQAQYRFFVLAGLSAGVACLFRATAPVYLVLAMAPMIAWFVIVSPMRLKLLKGVTLASVVCAAVCGWFYWLMFDYLYFYYAVWNTHANEGLSVIESAGHIEFVQNHFGWIFTICLMAIICTMRIFSGRLEWSRPDPREIRLLACLLLAGAMPLLFLIGRGAGLNPFVSMPVTCGVFMIGAVFLGKLLSLGQQNFSISACAAIVSVCVLAAGFRGYEKHKNPKLAEMNVHQQLIDTIWMDAQQRGLSRFDYSTLEMTEITTSSLQSSIIFDRASQIDKPGVVFVHGVRAVPQGAIFRLPAVADWNAVAGISIEEKVFNLSQSGNAWLDYIVIVNDSGSEEFQKLYGHIVVNRHSDQVREKLMETGKWAQVGPKLLTDRGYSVSIFRNDLKTEERGSLQRQFAKNHRVGLEGDRTNVAKRKDPRIRR